MHIPENYLSPATCAVMTASMIPVWSHAVKKIKYDLPKEKLPMLGVGAAFSFVAMMLNVPLIGGTTGHAVGGTLIALMFGPNAACIAVSIALLIQALIFGDGGILALGANCFNMAFVLPYVGYFVYKRIVSTFGKQAEEGKKHRIQCVGAAVGAYIGMNAAAFMAALEFGTQPLFFKDAMGNALYCPYDLSVSIPAMMIPHLLVAGIVEAAFTVAVFSFVRKTDGELIYAETEEERNLGGKKNSHFPVYLLLTALIILTPLGLLAKGTAWGEWSAEELLDLKQGGKVLQSIPEGMKNGWSLQVLLPDYSFSGLGEKAGYILSAVLGVIILIMFFKVAVFFRRDKKTNDSRMDETNGGL